ncbi:hypothetical protein [Vaginisenegalia massiliensis]|uniref:hypothetical protein n=1 Tax=Vaginisenegalia massiliensis TaxID=2058294 RepID=UPI0013DE2E7F|nr:hypothetical protein [Vaginisenegalia massiliensis]
MSKKNKYYIFMIIAGIIILTILIQYRESLGAKAFIIAGIFSQIFDRIYKFINKNDKG